MGKDINTIRARFMEQRQKEIDAELRGDKPAKPAASVKSAPSQEPEVKIANPAKKGK